jgi:hypothetical protein
MSRKFLMACCAAALVATGTSLRADDVMFTFRAQVTQVQYPDTTSFQVGDPFVVSLDFTPNGITPALGFYVNEGKRNGGDLGVHNFLRHGGVTSIGMFPEPPYWDNYFANFDDPMGFQMYCHASVTCAGGTLYFGMFDESSGPWGALHVGPEFPGAWLSDMSNPLPGDVDSISFSASGPLYFNYLNAGGANLTGAVTGGTVTRLKTLGYDKDASGNLVVAALSASPVPEPSSLACVLAGVAALLSRRRACRPARHRSELTR